MKQPVLIHLPDDLISRIKLIKYEPGLCAYHVPYTACELIPLPGAPIIRQQFRHVGFYMQLLEINASEDIAVTFSVLYPATFLSFMLRGTINFFDEQGKQISQALAKTFYLSYNGMVTYEARLKKGLNQILVVTLSENELLPAKGEFPQFGELMKHLADHSQEPVILPYCPIGQTIWNYLNKILHYTAINTIERGPGILVLLTKCLTFYHKLLENEGYLLSHLQEADANRLKVFLQLHYHTELVNRLPAIAAALNLTQWEIRKLSLKYFGKPIHQYIIDVRMKKATDLLRNTDDSIRDVALNIGYDNEAYFSKAFTKYYHISPAVYRKNE